MTDIKVMDYISASGIEMNNGKDSFTFKPIIAPTDPDAKDLHLAFIEVEPGKSAFSYHWHEMGEEVFYIIKGKGLIATPNGEIEVKEGNVICFPTGENGAHSIKNISKDEKLIYIDVDAHKLPEIIHYPEDKKAQLIAPYTFTAFNEE